MKHAFSRPTTNNADQRLLFTRFRSFGYDGLQLKAGQYHAHLGDAGGFLRQWGEDAGLVSGLIWGGLLDERGIAGLRQVIAFAHTVGSERIIFCHGVSRQGLTTGDRRSFARILSDLGREAADQGVRLSLHHHYGQPVMQREEIATFFDEIESGTVGLTVDTAHLVKSGVHDIAGVIRDFAPVLDNIHLKDFAGGEFRVLGTGAIDFGPFFAALKQTGYAGWICADEESGGDLIEGMQSSAAFIRAHD